MDAGKFIDRKSGAHTNIFWVIAFDHHVRFTNGVGLVIDLFTIEIDIAGGLNFSGLIFYEILRLGKHAAGTAGRVVNRHNRRQSIFDRFKDNVGHQVDHFTGG